jgi:carboxyl-terminal processing protease
MSRPIVLRCAAGLLLLGWLCGTAPEAQALDPAQSSADEAFTAGLQLEHKRYWRDAIDLYEDALQAWPENENLTYGLRRAKFQFGIERRYADDSFRSGLLRLSGPEALDALDNVLTQIQVYFVEAISTQSIIAHGTESLWLALANEKFLEQNAFGADPQRVQELRTILRERYWNKAISRRDGARQTVREVCDLAQRMLGLHEDAVIMEYVFGACNCLDDYSSVLTPTRYDDLNSNIRGQFVGVGIVIEGKSGKGMWLVDVLPDSPAERSGLEAGDWIVGIEGVDCRAMTTEEAAHLLTGPPGSRVSLEIARGESTRSVACTRQEVVVKSIPVATMVDSDSGVAYLKLTAFQRNSSAELDQALQSLQRQGMRSLVWDVRGNPGGLLDEAVAVLDRFLDDGLIVSTKGRASGQDKSYYAYSPGTWRVPLVLLIDGDSASASEIVAGAIRDHHRGTIVGRKSYGKWSVQSIYPASHGMALRLTTARFYSPNGHTYSKIGIEPDLVVAVPDDAPRPRSARTLDPDNDPDLRAALEVLSGQSYSRR